MFNRFRKKLVNTVYSVFKWENLPDSVDEQYLSRTLIENGITALIKQGGEFYAVQGNVGGELNAYYKGTSFIYANPVLGSGQPEIGKECAVIWLTSYDEDKTVVSCGLRDLIDSTASILADNWLSLSIALKNTRLQAFITGQNESERASAEFAMRRMYDGEPFTVALENLIGSIKVNPISEKSGAKDILQELIEVHQYTLAMFYQELGINANFNMKRERLTTSEVDLNTECLDTIIDNIERTINKGLEIANALYDTDIKFSVRRYGEENTAETGIDEPIADSTVVTTQPEEQTEGDGENV